MEESMKINSGAVLSSLPNDAHVLAVDSGGGLQRLPVSTLKSGIRADLGVSMSRNITVAGEQWVRVAKNTHHDLPFCGVLTLTHSRSSGMPVPRCAWSTPRVRRPRWAPAVSPPARSTATTPPTTPGRAS